MSKKKTPNGGPSEPNDPGNRSDSVPAGAPYEVGYRRPPQTSQFTKGKSGNPTGRPKGSKNLNALLSEALLKSVTVREHGKIRKMPKYLAAVEVMLNKALQGDRHAFLSLKDCVKQSDIKDSSLPASKQTPDEMSAREQLDQMLNQIRDRMVGHTKIEAPKE